jgi:hypothetical protein
MRRVVWCDHGWIPYHYGFCPDEVAWKMEMRRLGVTLPYPSSDGACTHFEKSDRDGDACSIVTINHKKRKRQNVTTLIVHESMHIWRRMREEMGEETPSSEFEAYTMQNVVHHLLTAYEKTRGKLFR